MPSRFGRVPVPAEVRGFEQKVGGDGEFVATRQAKHGAVIADADAHPTAVGSAGLGSSETSS